MPWNPAKYNEFKEVRFLPFEDLTSHITDKPSLSVLDLGCGTGELTQRLFEKLTNPVVVGIDSSAEMLAKAPTHRNLTFKQIPVAQQLNETTKWDLIFSNAALQWIDDHKTLFPKIISRINKGGQLAVQMPQQTDNILNKILLQLVQEEPYASYLNGWKRTSPVLTLDEYAQILFSNGGENLVLYQKVYPIISRKKDDFFNFIAGSALTAYEERMETNAFNELTTEFKKRIDHYFPDVPSIYAFKRLIIYASF